MASLRSKAVAVSAAALLAAAAAAVLDRLAPPPNVQPSHGGEDAFGSDLSEREMLARGPQRWMRRSARFVFRNLPGGAASVEVRIRGHLTPVAVLANGSEAGVIEAGRFVGRYAVPEGPRSGTLVVELRTPGFLGGDGSALGAIVDRVRVVPGPHTFPSPAMLAAFAIPACVLALAAIGAGLAPWAALLLSAAVTAVQALTLWPDGLVRSGYAVTLPGLLVASTALAAAGARVLERRKQGSKAWVFGALLAALMVQGVAATSPLMVSSDVVFHANRLRDVAEGDYYPTSVTQHAVPFRIPYGVSFYALLAPLARLGLDRVALVRAGAGLASVVASAALVWLLLPLGAARAALAALMLQVLPGSFDVYSYGNLSNAFGQACTALFFVWWVGGAPLGIVVGSLLLALGCLSHLSALIVLGVLSAALVIVQRTQLRRDRTRLIVIAVGFGLAILYYSHFAGLVASQLPRLLEGGGQGRGASRGAWDALILQLRSAGVQWGIPAILLAFVGRPRPSGGPLYRDLTAYVAGMGFLALPAIVSPLEVRYLYALGLPVATFAADGWRGLRERGGVRAGLAWALVLAQIALAAHNIVDAVLYRYRS